MSPPNVQPDGDPMIRTLRMLRDRFVLIYLVALILAVALAPRFRGLTEEQFDVDVNPGLASTDARREDSAEPRDPLNRVPFTSLAPLYASIDEEPIVETIEPLTNKRGLAQDLDTTAASLLSPPFELWPSNTAEGIIGSDAWLLDRQSFAVLPAVLRMGTLGGSGASSGGAGGSSAATFGGSTVPEMPPFTRAPSVLVSHVPEVGHALDFSGGTSGGVTYRTNFSLPSADDEPNGEHTGNSTNPPVSVPEPNGLLVAGLGATVALTRRVLRSLV